MGGSSGQPTQTTTGVNPQGDSLIKLGLPFAEKFAASPPKLPSTPLVAGFDPLQTQGQEMVLGQMGAQGDIAGLGKQIASFLSGDVLRPESNPALQATIDAAVRPISQNLLEQQLPALRTQATQTGNFGSTRRQIAEGLATGRANQAIGDTSAKIATQGYQSGLDALLKNLALLPQTSQLQLTPGLTTSGVGDVRQQQRQTELGEQTQRSMFDQLLPLIMAQNLVGLGASVPTREVTAAANTPKQNPWMQAVGLGSQLLPLVATAFSDRRLKQDVRQVGTLRGGTPVFEYRYRGQRTLRRGFMADAVPEAAVFDFCGFKAVDYAKVLELDGVQQ